MKTLIVEDEITSRVLLRELLKRFGPPHVAMNGKEAVAAVSTALLAGEPYDLICLDIMMPEMDGQEALKRIRQLEDGAQLAPESATTSWSSQSTVGRFSTSCGCWG